MTLVAATPAATRIRIPQSHVDLLTGTACGVVTSMSVTGQPHSAIVWVDYDGSTVLLNTTLERATGRNLAANGRVSLVVVDPEDTTRFIAITGDAELSTRGAVEHADALARRYTEHDRFYGCVYPLERQGHETRVIARIQPTRVTLDAIHR